MELVGVVLFLLTTVGLGSSARILAVFPFPGKSHDIFFSSIIQALTGRGHEVVVYSPFPPIKPPQNYSHVEIHTNFEEMNKKQTFEEFINLAQESVSLLTFAPVWFMTYDVCEDTFKNKRIQELLSSDEHFDLIFVESTFGQESLVAFGHKFNAPVIALQAFNLWSVMNTDAGNTLSIASVPDFTSLPKSELMSFPERLLNLVSESLTLALYYSYHVPRHDALVRKYYRPDVPPLVDMVGNISLYFVNSHPEIMYPQPATPNIVYIAGITISPERLPLPKELQKFMDEAKDGVIYFSLGTVVPTQTFPKEVLQKFVNVFKTLKQRVVWKLVTSVSFEIPNNVMVMKWVPQPGVLAHSRCVLFITHGGLFSQMDSLHAGVPTVSIPFFGDQPYNVRFSENRGFGVNLDFSTLSESSITTAVRTVLDDPRYRENAQRLSRVFRDRPVSPSDSVVYWTEYVLRHAGAHHLRPASTRLSWYQLALLDVLAVILLAVIAVAYLIYVLVWKGLCLLCSRKKSNEISSKKKNK